MVAYWCKHAGVQGQDADDLLQDVFQAVVKNLESFRREQAGQTFRGWLRGITRNKVRDYYRRRANEPTAQGGTDAHLRLQQVAEAELPADTEDDLSALYRRALDSVRSEFEDKTWQAFWQTAVDNQAAADVAAELGMTSAAVRRPKSARPAPAAAGSRGPDRLNGKPAWRAQSGRGPPRRVLRERS